MPRRSPGSIILASFAAAALAVPAAAQSSASATVGVRAVILPLVRGAMASELAEPTARFAAERTTAADSPAPPRALGPGASVGAAAVEGPARSGGAEPPRYRAVVRLEGVDGAVSGPLRVRDADGRTRDLGREAAVLVSDAPAVEVRRALARLLASAAQRPLRAARSSGTEDVAGAAPAGSTIRLTVELTPSTMLTQ